VTLPVPVTLNSRRAKRYLPGSFIFSLIQPRTPRPAIDIPSTYATATAVKTPILPERDGFGGVYRFSCVPLKELPCLFRPPARIMSDVYLARTRLQAHLAELWRSMNFRLLLRRLCRHIRSPSHQAHVHNSFLWPVYSSLLSRPFVLGSECP
jgi:hypothetical protein